MSRLQLLLSAMMLAGFVFAPDARACSVCSCGDPSTTACSRETVEAEPRWAVAVESRYFSKENSSEEGDGTEAHYQTQVALAVSRTLRGGFEVYGRLPYVTTTLSTTGEGDEAGRIRRSGSGDAELLARYSRRTSSAWTPSLAVGVKAPTGNNDLRSEGERLTEHAQPGTGSWDGYAVLSVAREGDVGVNGSVGYRYNGKNRFGQRYGQVGWVQAGVSRPALSWLRLDGALRYRSAARDRTPEGLDGNSGGTLLSGVVGVRLGLFESVALRVSGAFPLADHLHGSQKEDPQIEGGFVLTF